MPISRVVFGGQTLIDLTQDTVDASALHQGVIAHDKAGNKIVGTALPVVEEDSNWVIEDSILDSSGAPIMDNQSRNLVGRKVYAPI